MRQVRHRPVLFRVGCIVQGVAQVNLGLVRCALTDRELACPGHLATSCVLWSDLGEEEKTLKTPMSKSKSTVPQSGASAPDRSDASGYLAVVAATVCWGTSGVFVKFIVADTGISALSMAFWRDMFTFATLLAGVGLLCPVWLRTGQVA